MRFPALGGWRRRRDAAHEPAPLAAELRAAIVLGHWPGVLRWAEEELDRDPRSAVGAWLRLEAGWRLGKADALACTEVQSPEKLRYDLSPTRCEAIIAWTDQLAREKRKAPTASQLRIGAELWAGRLDEARSTARRGAKREPREAIAHLMCALVEVARAERTWCGTCEHGIAGRAVTYASRAVDLAPDLAPSYLVRGASQAMRAGFQGVLDGSPQQARATGCAASVARAGQPPEIMDFSRAIELAPDLAAAYFRRGEARAHAGDKLGALEDLARATQIDPECIRAYRARGNVHRAMGNHEEGLADYTRALALCPGWPPAHWGRAAIYLARGEVERAIEDYEAAGPSTELPLLEVLAAARRYAEEGHAAAAAVAYRYLLAHIPATATGLREHVQSEARALGPHRAPGGWEPPGGV